MAIFSPDVMRRQLFARRKSLVKSTPVVFLPKCWHANLENEFFVVLWIATDYKQLDVSICNNYRHVPVPDWALKSILPNFVFLRFRIFTVKLSHFWNIRKFCIYNKMAKLNSEKWMEKSSFYEEKSSLGNTKNRAYCIWKTIIFGNVVQSLQNVSKTLIS
jgi:hypothetical protein